MHIYQSLLDVSHYHSMHFEDIPISSKEPLCIEDQHKENVSPSFSTCISFNIILKLFHLEYKTSLNVILSLSLYNLLFQYLHDIEEKTSMVVSLSYLQLQYIYNKDNIYIPPLISLGHTIFIDKNLQPASDSTNKKLLDSLSHEIPTEIDKTSAFTLILCQNKLELSVGNGFIYLDVENVLDIINIIKDFKCTYFGKKEEKTMERLEPVKESVEKVTVDEDSFMEKEFNLINFSIYVPLNKTEYSIEKVFFYSFSLIF